MTKIENRPRHVLLWMTLAATLASPAALAGLSYFFGGEKPLLTQRTRAAPDGIALDANFRVGKKCGYEFELRLLHQHGRMGELDPLIGGKEFPVPVTLRVTRVGSEKPGDVLQRQGAPHLSGHAPDMTTFEVARASLGRGRYRVELDSAAVPKLANVDIDFVVHRIPKASCR
jgi:hypothetical protein